MSELTRDNLREVFTKHELTNNGAAFSDPQLDLFKKLIVAWNTEYPAVGSDSAPWTGDVKGTPEYKELLALSPTLESITTAEKVLKQVEEFGQLTKTLQTDKVKLGEENSVLVGKIKELETALGALVDGVHGVVITDPGTPVNEVPIFERPEYMDLLKLQQDAIEELTKLKEVQVLTEGVAVEYKAVIKENATLNKKVEELTSKLGSAELSCITGIRPSSTDIINEFPNPDPSIFRPNPGMDAIQVFPPLELETLVSITVENGSSIKGFLMKSDLHLATIKGANTEVVVPASQVFILKVLG